MHKVEAVWLVSPQRSSCSLDRSAAMSETILGIDIAKDSFQVTLLHGAKSYRAEFANESAGFAKLGRWLHKHGAGQVHACLEATGRYGDELAQYLHEAQHTVSVVNPARIKAYAQSRLSRNKTDALDADVIAHFCLTQQPDAWAPPAPEIRELQALLRQLEALEKMRQQERNRLVSGLTEPTVRQLIEAHVQFIDQQLAQLKRLIDEHLERHPDLKQQRELLTSIQGIGQQTAAHLIAKDLRRFASARAVVADAGLNPQQDRSGKSRRPARLSKVGDASLRKALYFPAIVAKNHNPLVKAFCARLAQRGKCNMSLIGAAMRKLLCLAYGVLKSGKPFDPDYAAHGQTAP
jgi:transposase